jgi:predicted amidohydrolase
MINIGLIQMYCEKGAVAANLAQIESYLAEAGRLGVDILAFPEMSLTGYNDPAKYPGAVLRLDGPEVARVCATTRGYPLTLLVGLIEANPSGKPYITHIAVRDGRLLGSYRKRHIIDDEAKWFTPGGVVPVFRHGDLCFGIAICADISNEQVFADCARQGAQVVFEVAAPGLYGEQATRNWQTGFAWWEGECQKYLSQYAQRYGIWVAVATQAGRTVDEDFPGGGYVFAPNGRRLYATPDWRPGAAYLALDLEGYRVLPL